MQALPINYIREMLDRAAVELERKVKENLEHVSQFSSSFYRNVIDQELLNFGFECEDLEWLFSEDFFEALIERRGKVALVAEEKAEYKEIMAGINEAVKYLWDREETHEMGFELDSLVGSLMGYYSSEFYAQGLKDGYNLANLLNGNKA